VRPPVCQRKQFVLPRFEMMPKVEAVFAITMTCIDKFEVRWTAARAVGDQPAPFVLGKLSGERDDGIFLTVTDRPFALLIEVMA
jgi:hypothetical protein